jgi:hypothetical protein
VSGAGDRPADVEELLTAYTATAERWQELRTDARAVNPLFGDSGVRNRVANGRLHGLHAAVVSVVPPALLTPRGRISSNISSAAR